MYCDFFLNLDTSQKSQKLLDDPQWVGKHLHLTLQRPKKETLPIVAKLLGGPASRKRRRV